MRNNILLTTISFIAAIFYSCNKKQSIFINLTTNIIMPSSTSANIADADLSAFKSIEEYHRVVDSFKNVRSVYKEAWNINSNQKDIKFVFQYKGSILYFLPKQAPSFIEKHRVRLMTIDQADSFFKKIYKPFDYYSTANKYYDFYFITDSNTHNNTYQIQKAEIEDIRMRAIQ